MCTRTARTKARCRAAKDGGVSCLRSGRADLRGRRPRSVRGETARSGRRAGCWTGRRTTTETRPCLRPAATGRVRHACRRATKGLRRFRRSDHRRSRRPVRARSGKGRGRAPTAVRSGSGRRERSGRAHRTLPVRGAPGERRCRGRSAGYRFACLHFDPVMPRRAHPAAMGSDRRSRLRDAPVVAFPLAPRRAIPYNPANQQDGPA